MDLCWCSFSPLLKKYEPYKKILLELRSLKVRTGIEDASGDGTEGKELEREREMRRRNSDRRGDRYTVTACYFLLSKITLVDTFNFKSVRLLMATRSLQLEQK